MDVGVGATQECSSGSDSEDGAIMDAFLGVSNDMGGIQAGMQRSVVAQRLVSLQFHAMREGFLQHDWQRRVLLGHRHAWQ